MIVICHGMVKSASSFATQIVIELAKTTGQPIYSLKQYAPESNGLYLDLDKNIGEVLQKAEESTKDGYLVIKTHAKFAHSWIPIVEHGDVRIISSFRDPAEIALSLIDAGHRDENSGRVRFNAYKSVKDTLRAIDWQIECFASWVMHCPRTTPLYFDDLAFAPFETAALISNICSIKFTDRAVAGLLKDRQNNIWEFNKGHRSRAAYEMEKEDYLTLQERWKDFYQYISDRDTDHLKGFAS